jgi:hypothetical protein
LLAGATQAPAYAGLLSQRWWPAARDSALEHLFRGSRVVSASTRQWQPHGGSECSHDRNGDGQCREEVGCGHDPRERLGVIRSVDLGPDTKGPRHGGAVVRLEGEAQDHRQKEREHNAGPSSHADLLSSSRQFRQPNLLTRL